MGTLPPGDTEPRALCKALPAQRPHHPLGALGLALLQEGPLIWRLWAYAEGNRQSKSMGWGAVCLANPPQRPQPQDSPAWGLKPAQTPGM